MRRNMTKSGVWYVHDDDVRRVGLHELPMV